MARVVPRSQPGAPKPDGLIDPLAQPPKIQVPRSYSRKFPFSASLAEAVLNKPNTEMVVHRLRFPESCAIVSAQLCIGVAPPMQPTRSIIARAYLNDIELHEMPVVRGINEWPTALRPKVSKYDVMKITLSTDVGNGIILQDLDFMFMAGA